MTCLLIVYFKNYMFLYIMSSTILFSPFDYNKVFK